MNVHCVVGPISTGKTTFIDDKWCVDPENVQKHHPPFKARELAVIVRVGKFLRESIGITAMASDPNPLACAVTEYWVRKHVHGALWTARTLNRPVVFDAQPRSLEQVRWFNDELIMLDSTRGKLPKVQLIIWSLEKEHAGSNDPVQKEFDDLRREQSRRDHQIVLNALMDIHKREVHVHVVS